MEPTWINNFFRYSKSKLDSNKLTVYQTRDGYSYIGTYPTNYKRQMGLTDDVEVVPFYKFYFNKDEIVDSNYIALTIDVGMTSIAREGDNVRYMLNDSRIKRFHPIDFVTKDNYYIHKPNGKVFKKVGKKYKAVDLKLVYERMNRIHCSNVFTLMGVYRRTKIFLLRTLPSLATRFIAWILGFVYWFMKGSRSTYDVLAESIRDRRDDQDAIVSRQPLVDNIDFFGYKVSTWTLFSYSLLIIFVFFKYGKSISDILSSNDSFSGLYVIAFAIVSIVIYDKIAPKVINYLVKRLSIFSFNLKYRGVKLKV